MKKILVTNIWYYIAWIQAFLATSISLVYSEILKYPPCTLCWYQRIFMYPIWIILTIAILTKDKRAGKYLIPLAIIGTLFAAYHTLIQYNIIPEQFTPCTAGISCTEKYVNYFGFITIPLLSLIAFIIILSSLIIEHQRMRAFRKK